MITEDYVSFETAKLLKEKGFDELCHCFYEYKKRLYNDMDKYFPNGMKNSDHDKEGNKGVSAPTLQMAMKWLREVHNIGVFPSTYTHIADGKTIHSYGTAIINLKTYELMTDNCLSNDTYEDAVEDAIKYCLENLIK